MNELAPFEKDLIALVKNIKIRKAKKPFPEKSLARDIKIIRTSDKTMTFPDKTNYMYTLRKDLYKMLLNNSITSLIK